MLSAACLVHVKSIAVLILMKPSVGFTSVDLVSGFASCVETLDGFTRQSCGRNVFLLNRIIFQYNVFVSKGQSHFVQTVTTSRLYVAPYGNIYMPLYNWQAARRAITVVSICCVVKRTESTDSM
jgi:hypothetical protein